MRSVETLSNYSNREGLVRPPSPFPSIVPPMPPAIRLSNYSNREGLVRLNEHYFAKYFVISNYSNREGLVRPR